MSKNWKYEFCLIQVKQKWETNQWKTVEEDEEEIIFPNDTKLFD